MLFNFLNISLSWRTGEHLSGEPENISMFSTCSELTPRAPIPNGRMERIMLPCHISGAKWWKVKVSHGKISTGMWLLETKIQLQGWLSLKQPLRQSTTHIGDCTNGKLWLWRKRSQINAINVTMDLLIKAIWGNISKHTVEKSRTNATNVIMHPPR